MPLTYISFKLLQRNKDSNWVGEQDDIYIYIQGFLTEPFLHQELSI